MTFIAKDFKETRTVHGRWTFIPQQLFLSPLGPGVYTEATLPAASNHAYTLIVVSDGTSGTNMVRYSDGTSWLALG